MESMIECFAIHAKGTIKKSHLFPPSYVLCMGLLATFLSVYLCAKKKTSLYQLFNFLKESAAETSRNKSQDIPMFKYNRTSC